MSHAKPLLISTSIFLVILVSLIGCADKSSPEPRKKDSSATSHASPAPPTASSDSGSPLPADSDRAAAFQSANRSPLKPPTLSNPGGKYGVASARVVYLNSRSGGYDTLFFDGFGAREAYYTALDTRSGKPRLWVALYANGRFVQYDALTHAGDRIDREQPKGPILGFIPDVWHPTPERAKIYNAASIEPREFLGRKADGFEFKFDAMYKLYLWEGIPMYQILTDLNDPTAEPRILEAKEVDVTSPVAASRFTVPRNVTLSEKGM